MKLCCFELLRFWVLEEAAYGIVSSVYTAL